MAEPTHGPKTGKDGRGRGKEKGPQRVRAFVGWCYGVRLGGWWLASQYS